MTKRNARWYHWAVLILCVLLMLAMGLSNLLGGLFPVTAGPFDEINDVVVRVLGVGLILSAFALFYRRNWAFIGAIILLAAQAVEFMAASVCWGSFSPLMTTRLIVDHVVILACLGAPIAMLVRMRVVFSKKDARPMDRQVREEPSS
jgi:hypothetical protein